MPAFVFRCPNTALNVQGHAKDHGDKGRAFEAILCTACKRVHWVNPKTGKLVGEGD